MTTRKQTETCFGCKYLTSTTYGDGTTFYGCLLCPGLIKGESSALSGHDNPKRCDKYIQSRGKKMTEFKNLDPSEVKRGDVIEVSANANFHDPYERIFVAYIEGSINPFICVDAATEKEFKAGEPFLTLSWAYARKLRPKLKIDDPVIVWVEDIHGDRTYFRRYFAGWTEDGRIRTFDHGATSWSCSGSTKTSAWGHWRLPTKEEIEGGKRR